MDCIASRAGSRIARFVIEAPLGAGGMAEVFRAVDTATGEIVALKVLSPALASRELEVRFRREASNAARLRHPGCVRVIDHGVADDGSLYLAMELLTGRTLRDELSRAGKFSPGHAVRVCAELLDALAHAHAAGILHRDVKPENVMFRRPPMPAPPVRVRRGAAPTVVLIDFGLSLLADDSPLTATGRCMGSPSYLAPERLLERGYDERADLYAVGVILYELLSGTPPFVGSTPTAIARQHLEREPAPIRDSRPDAPAALAAIVHRALAKDPAERFATAGEMLAALHALPPIRTSPYPVVEPADANSTMILTTADLELVLPPTPWRRIVRWIARTLLGDRRFATTEL